MSRLKNLEKAIFSAESAQIAALQILQFLAADEERLNGFLLSSGFTEGDLRAGAGDPAFLAGVTDYLLSNEQLLLAFSADVKLPPEHIMKLRRHLPGAIDVT